MNIPAMRTGEMKYVILRIDTHVLRIDLCPRKRTRIRRQKQDEDVHLFLSERKKARPLPRQRPSLTPPRPRKVSNKLFQGFRRVGKAQTSCFKVSEASGRLRTAPAGAGKLAGYPKGPECTYPCRGGRLRTPANFAGYPKGPECMYPCRGVLHTPPKRAPGPE